jgi:hypothetical protein
MKEKVMRLAALVLSTVMLVSTVLARGQQPDAAEHSKPKFTLSGDTALLTVAVKPDKAADFEQVMGKMKAALLKSEDPTRRAQAAGWKVMKLDKPLPDGNLAYVHMIHPVVAGADYAVMQTLYDAFPEERRVLYDLYRGAFVQNLSLATGHVTLDMSQQP